MKNRYVLGPIAIFIAAGLLFNLSNLNGFDDVVPVHDRGDQVFDAVADPGTSLNEEFDASPATRAHSKVAGPKFTLDISDGSHLVCSGTHDLAIPLKTQFGEVAIPLRLIQSIQFKQDHKTAVAQLLNKDRLTGTLGKQPLKVQTAMGEIAVPTNVILRLEIQRETNRFGPHPHEPIHDEVWEESLTPEAEPSFNTTTVPRRATPRREDDFDAH